MKSSGFQKQFFLQVFPLNEISCAISIYKTDKILAEAKVEIQSPNYLAIIPHAHGSPMVLYL